MSDESKGQIYGIIIGTCAALGLVFAVGVSVGRF